MHPGLDTRTAHNNHENTLRLAAALLLRFMIILSLLSYQGLPFIMIVPWPLNVAEDVRKLSICQGVGDLPSAGYDLEEEGSSYPVVSSSAELTDKYSPYKVIEGADTTMTSDLAHLYINILKRRLADLRSGPEKDEEDAMRKKVRQPLKLHDGDVHSRRLEENVTAVGGMKNPRVSLHKVPGHRDVGARVRRIQERFLEANPDVQ